MFSKGLSQSVSRIGLWACGLGVAMSAQGAAISGALMPQWLPPGSLDPVLKSHVQAAVNGHGAAAAAGAASATAPLQVLTEAELASLPLPAGGKLLPEAAGAAAIAVRPGPAGDESGACASTDCPQLYAAPLGMAQGSAPSRSLISWSSLEGQLFGGSAASGAQPGAAAAAANLSGTSSLRQGGIGLGALSLVLLLLGARRVLEIRRQRHEGRPLAG